MSLEISPPPMKRRRLNSPAPNGSIEAEHTTSQPCPATNISIYSWNVNGIAPFIQRDITTFFKSTGQPDPTHKVGNLRDVLRRYKWPTMLLLQEVKIHPDDKSTMRSIENSLRSPSSSEHRSDTIEPSYTARFCLPSDRYNARGFGRKVYGVCTIIRHDFYAQYVERVRKVSWDQEGRILICETKATADRPKLAVINIYAVNGTENPYKDSSTGEIVGTRHDRKLQVHKLLQRECRELEDSGFAVVLAGDLNIARAAIDGHPNLRTSPIQHCVNRADFEARFLSASVAGEQDSPRDEKIDGVTRQPGLGMLDTFRELYPTRRGYSYYPRGVGFGTGCDRVDLILISRTLRSALVDATIYATPADRGPSDHVPIGVTLEFRSYVNSSELSDVVEHPVELT